MWGHKRRRGKKTGACRDMSSCHVPAHKFRSEARQRVKSFDRLQGRAVLVSFLGSRGIYEKYAPTTMPVPSAHPLLYA